MQRSKLSIVTVAFLILVLSGCGLIIAYPVEEKEAAAKKAVEKKAEEALTPKAPAKK
jgi:hypothetical protein